MSTYKAALAAYVQRANQNSDSTVLPNTPVAIKRFQRFHGLTVDGIIGPQTRAAMRRTNTRLAPPRSPQPYRPAHTGPFPIGRPIHNY